jgi:hypothetical protein
MRSPIASAVQSQVYRTQPCGSVLLAIERDVHVGQSHPRLPVDAPGLDDRSQSGSVVEGAGLDGDDTVGPDELGDDR